MRQSCYFASGNQWGGPLRQYFTEQGIQLVVVVIGSTVVIALYGWHYDKGLIESFHFAILMWGWLFIAAGVLRVAYLPIQYLGHKLAVWKVERRYRKLEQQAAEKAAAGDELGAAQAEISRHIVSGNDPRFIPWWR